MSHYLHLTDREVAKALLARESLKRVAARLGATTGLFQARAARSALVRRALEKRRRRPRAPYPTFVDMRGWKRCGWRVVKRAEPRKDGSPQWVVRHMCGKTRVFTGSELRLRLPAKCRSCVLAQSQT